MMVTKSDKGIENVMTDDLFELNSGKFQVDTKEETDKKCPQCGGTMDFDPGSSGLLCPYCGHKKEIAILDPETTAVELDLELAETLENCDWGVEKKTVICKSCGAQSVYDALQISDECPYCGSNQVMEEKGKDTLAPGGVCVFKVTKEQAGSNFVKWIKGKLFCPRAAKQKAKPDAFKGVYLPYWTFDTQTESTYTARYGRDRHVTDSKGNRRTVTDWYPTSGEYSEFINDQAVLASGMHDPATLSKIEPYNTEDNLKYKPEYVAGFVSERYSIGLKEGWNKAKEYINGILSSNITGKIRREHHADHVNSLRVDTAFYNVKYKYLLLPVWISSFKYKSKVYQFMVNGQTGKVGGKSPISALRVMIAVLVGLAAVALFFYLSR
ncbi:MAG: TFIIB-type zinc ribbon-containing protein [Eubacteriales bacterium]|nr:TFIIB-type zinc ribbon-containing protein [Eubacteriales bacterium]